MSDTESSVTSPPPGWARRLPKDERVFLWLIAGSVLVMTVFVLGWLVWGKQNVPSTYRYESAKTYAAQVSAFVERYKGADGRVYVPPGTDAYMLATRYSWYPELVLQDHTQYRIWLSAGDVLHGFSLVGAGQNINLEISPNHMTGLNLTVGKPGRYLIVCNEYCGLHHQDMKGFLTVATAAELGRNEVAPPAATTTPAAASGSALQVTADPNNGLSFDKNALEVKAGTVTIAMKNPAALLHNVAIKGNGVDVKGEVVSSGATSTVTAVLKPGTYTFYCSVPGHEAAGMKGTLAVQP